MKKLEYHMFITITKKETRISYRFIVFYTERVFYTEGVSDEAKITILSTCDLPKYESLEYPISHPNHHVEYHLTSGYCNGIHCLDARLLRNSQDYSYFDEIIFWNPTTREVKLLPPNPRAPTGNVICFGGFGTSDPDTFDQFKYIQIYMVTDDNNIAIVDAELYDLNSDSWFVIHDIHDSYFNVNTIPALNFIAEAYCNGLYHWLSGDFTFILCFDFRCNKFRTIKTPSTTKFCRIIVANDCIAYLAYESHDSSGDLVEIWNLKQDESWVKQCKIGPVETGIYIRALLNDYTEFLAEPVFDEMPLYNSRGQLLRKFDIPAQYYYFCIYHHVETIAPLSL
ncbi:hypothetical protein TanjilG_23500 [Lupinus angustifolius]|uniref:F-box associated beta-propeller type 1 domain-containing protein n=1 Tax=Lupinus angustifolius TaxID=3871 RepID=A0A4P1R9Q8_LUPAN|nr:PREDICTED: uncharacterized protein LOC109354043 [Lupinus angustifolius]OIW05714.1 hypothetical protein TanjilG_23500 [Lupinus angustifolius]